jgi:hypothetical protein
MVPAAEMITYSVRGAHLPNRPERKPKLMVRIRTRIFVTEFDGVEIAEDMPCFRQYLRECPWLLEPKAEWDSREDLLVIMIETEGDDPNLEREGVLDEVWDCANAAFSFSSKRIAFDVLESRPVESPDP